VQYFILKKVTLENNKNMLFILARTNNAAIYFYEKLFDDAFSQELITRMGKKIPNEFELLIKTYHTRGVIQKHEIIYCSTGDIKIKLEN